DGLDEVPVQTDPTAQADRMTTLEAIRSFANIYQRTPIVLTCRVRAFTPDLRAKLGWSVETLAPFTPGQVRAFVPAWYGELVTKGQLAQDTATRLQQTLVQRILENRQLREMSATPLLLTMMALVLYNKGELPRDRPLLYEAILELLLGQWDKAAKESQTLVEVIGKIEWTSKDLRPVLNRLSYDAHTNGTADGRGRLRRESVRDALIAFFEDARLPDAWEAARRCLDYIEQRSGLLMPDANQTYVFAHLTLQEHCAGCHMTVEREDVLDQVLAHRADDRWHVPIMLGIGLADWRDQRDLLEALPARTEQGREKPPARWYRDLILAAEIGRDRDWNTLRTKPGLRPKIDSFQATLRSGLVKLLTDTTQPLPVNERVRAGFLLGDLGDPRFPVTVAEWQAEAAKALAGDTSGYFCKVAPGSYTIGSSDADPDADDREKPQHTVTFDAPFWMARLPITNAQWQAWVAQGGKPSYAADDSDLNQPNQPVVGVQWYWCRDFCRWLSAQTGLDIRLPSEAEWEAAARGGDTRRYPWDDDWRDDHAAMAADRETRGSRWSTPVGCYPRGAAPNGALDMAGNVWEWTQTPWTEHHALPRSQERADDAERFTLKGGCYRNGSTSVRCAARCGIFPSYWNGSYGLRVLFSPCVQNECS
ncbi:MAG: formylglycine-generating enzyme family protein, partial [Chloroflexaceae bacterium]